MESGGNDFPSMWNTLTLNLFTWKDWTGKRRIYLEETDRRWPQLAMSRLEYLPGKLNLGKVKIFKLGISSVCNRRLGVAQQIDKSGVAQWRMADSVLKVL